jgi:urease accessory protein
MSILSVIPSRKAIHGKGRAELHVFGDNAHFAELSYTYPLKLLSPRATTAGENEAAERVAILYSLTYGGGLIGGDRVELSLDLKDRAKLVLLTQVCTFLTINVIQGLNLRLVGVHEDISLQTQPKIIFR